MTVDDIDAELRELAAKWRTARDEGNDDAVVVTMARINQLLTARAYRTSRA